MYCCKRFLKEVNDRGNSVSTRSSVGSGSLLKIILSPIQHYFVEYKVVVYMLTVGMINDSFKVLEFQILRFWGHFHNHLLKLFFLFDQSPISRARSLQGK